MNQNQFEFREDLFSILDVKQFLSMLWSWIWLILLAGILTGGIAFLITQQATPVYVASATLLFNNPPSISSLDATSVITFPSMTNTYKAMASDTDVLQAVIDKLKLDLTADELDSEINFNSITGTQLANVVVRDSDPNRAVLIANTYGQVFADHVRELEAARFTNSQAGLAKQISDMEQQINLTNQTLANTKDPTEVDKLEAQLSQYRILYGNLVTNYQQVRLAEAQTGAGVVISQPAFDSKKVSARTTTTLIIGTFTGIFLVLLVLVVIYLLDDTLKNPDDLDKKFRLSILGIIAKHPTDGDKPYSLSQPRSLVAEAFRGLRTNLTFYSVDKPLRRILITSTMPQEGKTSISANLAVVFAQGEKKTLLIDGDMRRPQLDKVFGLPNQSGLSDLFVNNWEMLPKVLQTSDLPGLTVITAGAKAPNPAELLSSQKMVQILERLTQDYSLILVDTPPVLSVTDAAALAPAMDGLILVAQPGKTRMREFEQVLSQLHTVNAHILGVVLNDVDLKSRKYGVYFEHYGSTYQHYYDETVDKKKRGKPNSPQSIPDQPGA